MKKLLLILLVLPTISFAENKTCFVYIKENISDKDMFTAARQIRNSCDSGMILDYRVYESASEYPSVRIDSVANRKEQFCNFDKRIIDSSNMSFFGFICELK
jgi:hypothetical protein